eukprot:TRINITY_DN513_c0_g2_i1.p1 TRINITY_DN513_c0_g2~~TRINITY_DN513_c0_g2_i1.p1  ORF type:complete len:101 (-),score=14.61 TRINITY_DN513_c0_g2_i1:44-346(-)
MDSCSVLRRVDFEVFGRVQGVFFRKSTQKMAASLQIRGWIMNTERKTVVGTLEGEEKAMLQMKEWLTTKGSPSAVIERAEFRNESVIPSLTFPEAFEIRR